MVVEHERGALGEVEVRAEGEGEVLRRDRRLGPAAEGAEGRDVIAGLDGGAVRGADHDAADLAAGDERERRFHLIFAPRLQELREGHAGGVDLDQNALSGGEHV